MRLFDWLDHRTGYRALVREALYERIPGGARWRYVWGSTLVFAFFVQVITGICLWMSYSPSAQTAWESVYFIQYQTQTGWLLRGLHHFMSQAMVVLLALHLLQVVIDGAYRAPREVNFWLGLVLLQIVLGLALTGYLLPWDQKGYWATRVATNLMSLVPVIGQQLQLLVVGGPDYGHHTLTRFFTLHAGVLPAMLVVFLALHLALFRRHGICYRQPVTGADGTFWPDQALRDAVACLAVLIVVLLLAIHFDVSGMVRGQLSPDHRGAELGAPADPSTAYSAARPEWYFLFLFQLLKLFEGSGETGERIGTIFIPGFIMLVLFLMPLIGRWKLGHRFNVEFLLGMLLAVAGLTAVAWWEDHRANWTDATQFAEIAELSRQLGQDEQKITAHFGGDAAKIAEYHRRLRPYEAYRKSLGFLAAVKQAVEEAQRACQLASGPHRIPASGALSLLREDPLTEGPRLFQQNCTGCHCYFNPDDVETPAARDQLAKASAPNLYGFGSRRWLAGLLNAESIAGPQYYGATTKYKKLKATGKSLEMVDYVVSDVSSWPADEVKQIAAALSAQAQLPAQQELDQQDQAVIDAGAKLIADTKRCASCHRFDAKLPAGDPKLSQNDTGYPDLTHYGSREWMSGMICNPRAPRFYGEQNDRMPAFAPHEQAVEQNRLSRRQIELIVDWLRGDYLQPAPPAPGD